MQKPPLKREDPFGPGSILGSDDLPFQSLIHDVPPAFTASPSATEASENTPLASEFIRDDQARRFGRQVAEVNPPLDRSKIFRG